jgi:hypothetical protein
MTDRFCLAYSNRTPTTSANCAIRHFLSTQAPPTIWHVMYARWKQIEFFAPILTIYREESKVRIFDTKIGHFQNNNVSFIMNKHSSSEKRRLINLKPFLFFKRFLKRLFHIFSRVFPELPNGRPEGISPPLSRPPGRQAHTTLSYHPTLIQYLKSADGVFLFYLFTSFRVFPSCR